MGARKLDMKRLGVGGLITEFMAVPGTPNDDQDNHPEILDQCDKHHVGWFAWRYHSWLNTDMIIRTYAQRVGGKAVEQKFNAKTKKYMLYFQAKAEAGYTRIYFSK